MQGVLCLHDLSGYWRTSLVVEMGYVFFCALFREKSFAIVRIGGFCGSIYLYTGRNTVMLYCWGKRRKRSIGEVMFHKIFLFILYAVLTVSAQGQAKPWTQVLKTLPNRPDGAFIRLYSDKTFQLFAVGSAAYEKNADQDDMLRIERQASMQARAELMRFIQQSLSAETSIKESYQKAEIETSENGQRSNESSMISEQDFLNQMKSSSSMMIKGIVTLKVITVPKGSGGIVKALVGVSSVTQQTAAAVQAESNAPAAPAAPVNAATAPPKADNEWIECVGRGADHENAVKSALIEGIQQVYGVYLENEESMKKRFEQMKRGSTFITQKNTSQTRSILTRTKGFIREYRIIAEIQNGSFLEARVKAWIVNPRAGGIRTVMLYPMSIRADRKCNDYDVGPELRLSGLEIAALCSEKFEQAFNHTNQFVVLNKDDLLKVLQEQKRSRQMVLDANALPLEMAKMGQILCADYIFVPEFEDIKYTRKIVFDGKKNRFTPRVTLRLSFKYRIIDVRTGSQIRNEDLSVMLDDREIQQLPDEGGEKADMLRLLMNKTVAVLARNVNF